MHHAHLETEIPVGSGLSPGTGLHFTPIAAIQDHRPNLQATTALQFSRVFVLFVSTMFKPGWLPSPVG